MESRKCNFRVKQEVSGASSVALRSEEVAQGESFALATFGKARYAREKVNVSVKLTEETGGLAPFSLPNLNYS